MIAKEASRELPRNAFAFSPESSAGRIARTDVKDIYREFSRNERMLPIFFRDWWLDATAAPGDWNAALVKNAGEVVAAMPYVIRRRYGMTVLGQSLLTQKLGPWFRTTEGRTAARLAKEKSLMQELINQLPRFDRFAQTWRYDCQNWLPFFWNGFQQTTRYSYVLPDLSDLGKLWSGLQHTARGECKKAIERFRLQVFDDAHLPLDAFLMLNRLTFRRQGLQVPYSDAFVRRLDAACAERGCRKFFIAIDPYGYHHAGVYMVWDEHSTYALMTGANPALRNSGAATLCFWHAIGHAAGITRRFDFGGSMMKPVERFFRSFGAIQMPYSGISKTPSRLLRIQQGLQSVIRGR